MSVKAPLGSPLGWVRRRAVHVAYTLGDCCVPYGFASDAKMGWSR